MSTTGTHGWLPPIGRRAWLALGMNTLSCLGSGLTMPFLIVYLHAVRGIPLPTTGFVLAAIGVAGVVSTPLGGPLIDRIGALPSFILGLVLGGLGIAGFTLATSAPRALVAAIGYGIASGLMWNGFATLLAQLVTPAERGSVFALRYMSANVAFGAGALITGLVTVSRRPGPFIAILLADAASYLLFAAALLAVGATLTRGAPGGGPARVDPAERIGYRQVLRDRGLLGALLINSLLMVFAISQTNSTFPAWVTGGAGGSTRLVGFAFVLNITVLLLAQLPAIRFARGRSRTRGAATAAVFFAAAWIVLVLPSTAGLAGVARNALLVGALGVFAIGEALLSPTLPALINDLAPDRLRGRYNAVFSLSNQIGPVLAPALAGLALGYGHAVPYLYGLAVACLAIAVVARLLGRVVPAAVDLGVPAKPPLGQPATTQRR